MSSEPTTNSHKGRKRRSTCDVCYNGKVRCEGGFPCSTCEKIGAECQYGWTKPLGRPRGSRRRKNANGPVTPHSGAADDAIISVDRSTGRDICDAGIMASGILPEQSGQLFDTGALLSSVWPTPKSNPSRGSDTAFLSAFGDWPGLGEERARFTQGTDTFDVMGSSDLTGYSLQSQSVEVNMSDTLAIGPVVGPSIVHPTQRVTSEDCQCLVQFAQLIKQSRRALESSDSQQPGLFLSVSNQLKRQLDVYLACKICQRSGDLVTAVLSVMCVRVPLRSLREWCQKQELQPSLPARTIRTRTILRTYEMSAADEDMVLDFLLSKNVAKLRLCLDEIAARNLHPLDPQIVAEVKDVGHPLHSSTEKSPAVELSSEALERLCLHRLIEEGQNSLLQLETHFSTKLSAVGT